MSENVPAAIDEKLLHATVKLNTLLCAAVCSATAGLALLCATYVSLFRGLPNPGHFLNLLGVFLPGYRVSVGGAWIGLFWGGLLGAIFGALIYRVYARGIRAEVLGYLAGRRSLNDIERVVVTLHGPYLGVALGTVAALGLFITTNWLVLRGTAAESVHAALLSHYLPGYTVSVSGSLIGSVEVFVISYVACLLLAAVHNRVVAWRRKGDAP